MARAPRWTAFRRVRNSRAPAGSKLPMSTHDATDGNGAGSGGTIDATGAIGVVAGVIGARVPTAPAGTADAAARRGAGVVCGAVAGAASCALAAGAGAVAAGAAVIAGVAGVAGVAKAAGVAGAPEVAGAAVPATATAAAGAMAAAVTAAIAGAVVPTAGKPGASAAAATGAVVNINCSGWSCCARRCGSRRCTGCAANSPCPQASIAALIVSSSQNRVLSMIGPG